MVKVTQYPQVMSEDYLCNLHKLFSGMIISKTVSILITLS